MYFTFALLSFVEQPLALRAVRFVHSYNIHKCRACCFLSSVLLNEHYYSSWVSTDCPFFLCVVFQPGPMA